MASSAVVPDAWASSGMSSAPTAARYERTACSRAARRSLSAMAIRTPVAATIASMCSRTGCAGANRARYRSASAWCRRAASMSPHRASNPAHQAAAMPWSMCDPAASAADRAAADSSRAFARSPCLAAISASRSCTWARSSSCPSSASRRPASL